MQGKQTIFAMCILIIGMVLSVVMATDNYNDRDWMSEWVQNAYKCESLECPEGNLIGVWCMIEDELTIARMGYWYDSLYIKPKCIKGED